MNPTYFGERLKPGPRPSMSNATYNRDVGAIRRVLDAEGRGSYTRLALRLGVPPNRVSDALCSRKLPATLRRLAHVSVTL